MSILDQQKKLLVAIVGTALVSIGVTYIALAPRSEKITNPSIPKSPIHTPGESVQSNEVWMQQMSQEAKLQNKKMETLEKIIEKQALQERSDPNELAQMKQEIAVLKQQIEKTLALKEEQLEESKSAAPLVKHTLMLKRAKYQVGKYIPAGSYAQAVLLNAVDASVGVSVSADPQPVVMRMLSHGALPNNGSTAMKRCHTVGVARGDLSSERVFIRLEKMTCTHAESGHIIETDVAGYVVGDDGKTGITGTIRDRSGRMISHAILAGMLSGANSILQNFALNREKGTQDPRTIQLMPAEFSKAGTQSMGNAFDRLAEYYIKRAEQLQPVVRIDAG